MATAFNTQTGNGEYRLQFETDNMDHFLLMQATARQCIDGKPQTHADQIRAMSDEELVEFINHFNICDHRTNEECKMSYCACCEVCVMDWLQQPAEVSGDA